MENRSLTSRRFRKRKADYWPQIRQLALEGQTCRQIAADLGLHKTTVNNWLQELRQEFRENVADPAEITAFAVARLDVIYREAMAAWRRSREDKQIQVSEDIETDGERRGSQKKRSVRSETRTGDRACLAEAIKTVAAICKLIARDAPGRNKAAGPVYGPFDLNTLKREDLREMSEEELSALEAQIDAKLQADAAKAAKGPRPK